MLAALAATAALPLILAQTMVPPPWFKEINSLGWSWALSNDDTGQLIRPTLATQTSGNPKIWVRYENRVKDESGSLSVVDYDEVDCQNATIRILNESRYGGRNMTGSGTVVQLPSIWVPVAPGTLNNGVLDAACVIKLPPPRP